MGYNNLNKIRNLILGGVILPLSNLIADTHPYPENWNNLQNDKGWELVNKTEWVHVYSKLLEDSPIPALRAEIFCDVQINKLIDAAWQVKKSGEIFPNAYIIDAGIYRETSDTTYTAFQVFDIPLLSPRLYQFNSIRNGNSIHWVKTDTLSPNLNPKNYLMPPINFGSWEVMNDGDQSKLTYRVCTDPGGDVPHWLVHQANKKYIPQMLEDIVSFARNN